MFNMKVTRVAITLSYQIRERSVRLWPVWGAWRPNDRVIRPPEGGAYAADGLGRASRGLNDRVNEAPGQPGACIERCFYPRHYFIFLMPTIEQTVSRCRRTGS